MINASPWPPPPQCCDSEAAAATLELQGQVQHDPGAGAAQWVTDRDRAAVDVDLLLRQTEGTHRLDADRGEGLVEFGEIEVRGGEALPLQRLHRRVGWLQLQ